jgi:hypothetical protein
MDTKLKLTFAFAAAAAGFPQDRGAESRPGRAETGPAVEKIFSGPQAGEKALGFRVADVTGGRKEREFDPVKEANNEPSAYFFFPADVNRIIARALSMVGAACEQGKRHGLRSYFVGLTQDPLTADQRLRDVWGSLKIGVPATISLDGLEGPGSWALNKKCYVTIVLVKDGKVAFNYAALSPADSDYEMLRGELSKLLGAKIDAVPENPPPGMRGGRGEGRGEGRAEGPASRRAGDGRQPESRPGERPKERKEGGGR